MASIRERDRSRGGGKSTSGGNRNLRYIIEGTTDDATVQSLIEGKIPAIYQGRFFESYDYEPVEGGEIWEATARYTSRPAPGLNSPTGPAFSFDTSAGTQHITQSLQTVGWYPAPGVPAAPNFDGAINANGEQVQGCDIYLPVYNFTETHYFAPERITDAYKGHLFRCTGKMNTSGFKNHARGEVLFLGARGSLRTGEDWEITYSFAASPNASNLRVGPITVTAKLGWDYLWVFYAEIGDFAAKRVVQQPIAAYVERVYEFADYSTLGI